MDNTGLLYRIDERTRVLSQTVGELRQEITSSYVRKEEFTPVKRIVYGLTGVVLSSFIAALLAVVLTRGQG